MILLIIVPILTVLLGMLIYRFQGKNREVFSLDFVQFIYLFLMAPTLFVWLKTFLFYLLRNELDYSLSINELFVIDTIFTVIAVFVMAAISIHSLTKTFWIKRHHNPEFDIYHLSEYFHLWWSHIIIWGGAMLLISFVALTNVFAPLEIDISKGLFFFFQIMGVISGLLFFLAIWMSDPGQGNFMRLMKLLLVLFATVHIAFYFLFEPRFSAQFVLYWVSLSLFVSAASIGGLFEKHEKLSWFRKIMLHSGWGNNKGIDIFKRK